MQTLKRLRIYSIGLSDAGAMFRGMARKPSVGSTRVTGLTTAGRSQANTVNRRDS